MNVIQTEVLFPIAYTVMHYYFISKNLFPNHISYQDIQSTRKKKKTFRKISSNGLRTVMIYQAQFSRIFCLTSHLVKEISRSHCSKFSFLVHKFM